MEPALVSCHNSMDIIIIVAVHAQRFGKGILSQARLTMILGALPSLKDPAISWNQGSWAGLFSVSLPWGSNTQKKKTVCQLGAAGADVVTDTIVDGMTRGLECPRIWVAWEKPWGWALCILLLPHTPTAFCSSSSSSMAPLEGVIFFHSEGGSLLRTSSLVKVVIGFIPSFSSLMYCASCCLLWALDSWVWSAQNCNAFASARIFLGCQESVVQAPKVPLGLGKEGIPLYTVGCWW